jgi:diaminohydroxyphosphoribosylaminopyrimidine deaminase/5-amino-6-(5-phosphoribosylamino)uracil reductase
VGVLEAECRALNEAWLHFIATGRPLVTLKAAVTLDGRLAARGGDSKWVTGEQARAEAHRLRDTHDAILVGAGTVAADDPALTTRLPGGRDALRVILDGRLRVPARARALPGAIVFAARGAPARRDLERRGAEVVRLPGRGGRVDLRRMLEALGARGVVSLLVEGGGEVHGQLLGRGLIDRAAVFVAPKLIGAGGVPLVGVAGPHKMAEAWRLLDVEVRRLGDDVLVSGRLAGGGTSAG